MALAGGSLVVVLVALSRREGAARCARLAPWFVVVALLCEHLWALGSYNRWDRPARTYPTLPVMDRAAQLLGHERLVAQGEVFRPDAGTVYALRDSRLYDGFGTPHEMYVWHERGLLGTRKLAPTQASRTDGSRLILLPNPGGAIPTDVIDLSLERLPETDEGLRLAQDRLALPRARLAETPHDAGAVSYDVDDSTEVALRVRAARPGRLVLADLFYPGWRAWLDGVEVAVRCSVPYREVSVPGGIHRVVFRYIPTSYRVGLFCTLATLLAAIMALTVPHATSACTALPRF